MATGYLLSGAAFLYCSVWTLCAGGASRHAAGWGMRLTLRRVHELCAALAVRPPVSLLLGVSSWQRAADAAARHLRVWGVTMGRDEACVLLVLAGVLGSLVLGFLARSALGIAVGVLGVLVMVPVWDSSRTRARERALIDEMPEVFRTLAMALGSGETLTQAIEYVGVHERGYAGEAFVHAALRLRCGATTEDAMNDLARELEAPGVGLLTTALIIAQRTGSPLRTLFQSSAQLVERQGEYERMLAVRTAQVRLSVRIVCLLPLVLVCLLSLISVDFQEGLTTLAGTLSVLVAAVMDGCALLVIRRLMRGVL